ncbi:serine phosphatase RsbU (regulator of sigma subunit) [Phytomonospora endophytica]|uniref:Serine phosphatase RsbU (Regulator of sigma subunit) n=1 Tax=Phytomonospora endophytica TaxID=714109 RepID=A0A841FFI4_9ACTN|nr:serine phosphatase RsbU (regulator of sigma subunit) [Phytomonospora endophytica]GIG66986.1 membrane protein [Phytomonospora endophytica]
MARASRLRGPARSRASWTRPDARAGIGAAVVLLALIAAVELADGPAPRVVGLLATPPFVAAAFAGWRSVGLLGLACTMFGLGVTSYGAHTVELGEATDIAAIVVATGIAMATAVARQRQLDRMNTLTRLASVAQEAVLRPLGPQIGHLNLAARYVSASTAADIGGDLYEVVDTPYGTRMIIGDVRGNGLDAVRLASTVLGSYRHVAFERADLRAIVADLDRAVARSVGDEDFVTAALLEERGGSLTIVNCGHPPPMLLRDGRVQLLEPPSAAPPLGFMPVVSLRSHRLEPGDRLLLYTDGLTEARRAGEFFPISERAWGLLGHGSVGDGLASLESALREWVGGPLDDDIALVLVEYTGPRPGAEEAAPSWAVAERGRQDGNGGNALGPVDVPTPPGPATPVGDPTPSSALPPADSLGARRR